MTRLLIVSDTHGEAIRLSDLLRKYEGKYDRLVHLGDRVMDVLSLPENPVDPLIVRGNMETDSPGTDRPNDWNGIIDGVKILATHGHRYSVHSTLLFLKKEAKRAEASLVLFGHTHERLDLTDDGIRFFNPGAFRNGDYGMLTLDGGRIMEAFHDRLSGMNEGEK